MPLCFVMQPFDGGEFDKRYDDVLAPAVQKAGLEPYRVDRDASVSIPIQDIEAGIRNAEVCIAEITSDNPNVWFELGYAIACGKEVVLLCAASRRERFPFDVQHRNILHYHTESPRDFAALRATLVERLKAARQRAATTATIAESPVSATEGLKPYEIVALMVVSTESMVPGLPASHFQVQQKMDHYGFNEAATAIALRLLLRKGHLKRSTSSVSDQYEDYSGFELTERGEAWLFDNQHNLDLTRRPRASDRKAHEDELDDLPF